MKFVDIDTLIEIKEGRSIKVIFERKGENYFRKLEHEISFKKLKNEIL